MFLSIQAAAVRAKTKASESGKTKKGAKTKDASASKSPKAAKKPKGFSVVFQFLYC